MGGNSFGKMLTVTSFGESHGPAMGVVIDGIPGNIPVSEEDLRKELERRAPGRLKGTTSRKEEDLPEILSGVYEGKTLGTPIAVIVRNKDQRSEDYDALKNEYRPGHADLTTLLKYGHRDHRGGGRSSGRETLSRVIAGYFASLIIPQVAVRAFATQIGPYQLSEERLNNLKDRKGPLIEVSDLGDYGFPDSSQWKALEEYLVNCKMEGNSVGGRVMVVVDSCPVGLGEPAFDKLKADLAKGLLSIGAVTSFSYGLGEEFGNVLGQEISSERMHFGGMEGGISNGERIVMQVTFRPPSTVGEKAKKGRHDPCIIPRALPVVESMAKFVLADHYLRQRSYQVAVK